MTVPPLDAVCIGNALVDILAKTEDSFLESHDIPKGGMVLIDQPRATLLYDAMGPAVEVSGGSAGNTAAGIASLGGRAAFLGKVRDDQLGAIFTHDIRAAGVAFDVPHATSGPATGRSMILVTPDAARSMNTFLGAAVDFAPEDIIEAQVEAAQVTYMERAASGVTRIIERPVAGPLVAGWVSKVTPVARISWVKIAPSWSSRTLPKKAAWPPSEAMPAAVLPAEPPETSTAGPMAS